MKRIWAELSQGAIWLVGLIIIFVSPPPRLEIEDDPSTTVRFVQFAIAVLIGIAFLAFHSRNKRRHVRIWAVASILSLVVSITLFFAHMWMSDHWTCRYDGRTPMIIGTKYQGDAARYIGQNPGINCKTLIADYGGQTDRIWDRSELANRRLLLSGLFSLVVVFFSMTAVFVVQAIQAAKSHD